MLWPGGLVLIPPDDVLRDGSLRMKFPWWRGPGVRGAFEIRGYETHLGVAIRAHAGGYGHTGFNASAIIFPGEGCYQITATVDGDRLAFVTWVRSCEAEDVPPVLRDAAICRL